MRGGAGVKWIDARKKENKNSLELITSIVVSIGRRRRRNGRESEWW